MTTPVSGSTGTTDIAALMAASQKKPATGPNQELGKDTFLKLLVAQLKYQDPMNPADGSEFLAQSAQFTMVEKLEEISRQGAEMRTLAAAGLVGRSVSWIDGDGTPQSGEVEAVKQTASGSVLVVDGEDVPLASVTEVSQTAPTPSTDAPDTTASA